MFTCKASRPSEREFTLKMTETEACWLMKLIGLHTKGPIKFHVQLFEALRFAGAKERPEHIFSRDVIQCE